MCAHGTSTGSLWRRAGQPHRGHPVGRLGGALNLARLVGQSTALRSGHLDKQRRWRGLLAVAIAERLGVDEATDLRPAVYAAATLEALQIATDRWVASDGQLDLIALADEATSLLTPASRRRTARQSVESERARTSPPH